MIVSSSAFVPVELLDDAALPAHQDAVGELQDLRQVGRDHHHREAVVGEPVDELVDLGDGADVDAARRLVEDDELRLLDQRLGDDDLLLVAAGELDDARIGVDRLDVQRLDPFASRASRISLMLTVADRVCPPAMAPR